jgi:pullulanase/glycogen debranching enzyme
VLRVRDKKGKPAALEVLRKLGVAAVQHIPTEKFDEAHRLCEEALQ